MKVRRPTLTGVLAVLAFAPIFAPAALAAAAVTSPPPPTVQTAARLAVRHENVRIHWVFGRTRALEAIGGATVGKCRQEGWHVACAVTFDPGGYSWTDLVGRDGPCPLKVTERTGAGSGVATGTDRGWRGCNVGPVVVISMNPTRSA